MTIMKARLKGAQKGHSLLKKKADALTMRFRQILKKIIEVRSFDIYNYTNYSFDTLHFTTHASTKLFVFNSKLNLNSS